MARRCSGIPINIFNISKVFKAGYAALPADLETVVVDAYLALAETV